MHLTAFVLSNLVDIWSNLYWEIFSLKLQPYPSVNTFEMRDYLKSHKVLDKPSLSLEEM